jgi:hypothetical protein
LDSLWNRHPVLGGPTIIRQLFEISQRTLDENLLESEKNFLPDPAAVANQISQANGAL